MQTSILLNMLVNGNSKNFMHLSLSPFCLHTSAWTPFASWQNTWKKGKKKNSVPLNISMWHISSSRRISQSVLDFGEKINCTLQQTCPDHGGHWDCFPCYIIKTSYVLCGHGSFWNSDGLDAPAEALDNVFWRKKI